MKVKRHCRKCLAPLPASRYFNCFKCVELKAESDFDHMPCYDLDVKETVITSTKPHVKCTKCQRFRDVGKFDVGKTECRACISEKRRYLVRLNKLREDRKTKLWV